MTDKLEVGPALDAAVADLVTGTLHVPPVSTEIQDAWQVVESMQRRGWAITVSTPTAPEAISRAALKAVEASEAPNAP